MASILIAASVLSYSAIQKSRAKRASQKTSSTTRFSDLERDNAARIARLQAGTCFCQTSDWRGGGCEAHGYVPAAGEPGGPPAPGYGEVGGAGGVGGGGGTGRGRARASGGAAAAAGFDAPPTTRVRREPYPDYRYRRGEEDGALADRQGPPGPMPADEVRRINEERRKGMKAGGFTGWVLRRKGKGSNGDAVVR